MSTDWELSRRLERSHNTVGKGTNKLLSQDHFEEVVIRILRSGTNIIILALCPGSRNTGWSHGKSGVKMNCLEYGKRTSDAGQKSWSSSKKDD